MAAPGKRGLEYFSFDTNFFQDIKVRKLIKHKGSKAIPVYTYLLCIIYRDGYYIRWDEDLPFIISESTGYEEEFVSEVVEYCLLVGLFSEDLFRQKEVLTSKGIQTRYLKIMSSLKRKVIVSEFSLVSSEETNINSEVTGDNSELTPTKERKEIKEKKGKEEEEKASASDVPDFVSINRSKVKNDPPGLRPPPLNLDEYESELLDNRLFLETACMTRKVTEQDFRTAIREFFAEKRVLGHQPKSQQDIMQHFLNWLNIWKSKRDKEQQPGKLMQTVKTAVAAAQEINADGGFFTFKDLENS